jgi:hypothetical protein
VQKWHDFKLQTIQQGGYSMEPKRELGREPKAAAPAAQNPGAQNPGPQKTSGARKQPGQETAGMNQGASGQNAGDDDLLQHAKKATGEVMNQVQQRAGSQINQQKESAATDLSKVVNAVRQFGEHLSAEETGPIARYAAKYGDKAADSLERLSTYIREQDPKQLLKDVQEFGRRRPALLLGGAFLLGFAGARLIKSSMDAGTQHGFNANAAARPNVAANPNVHMPNVPAARPSQSPNA